MTVGLYKPQRKFLNGMKTDHLIVYWWDRELWDNEDKWEKFLDEVEEIQQSKRADLPYMVVLNWNNKINPDLAAYAVSLMQWLNSDVGEGNYYFEIDYNSNITNVYFKDKRKAFMFKLKWS